MTSSVLPTGTTRNDGGSSLGLTLAISSGWSWNSCLNST